MALSAKHQIFIDEYVGCWNATDAYLVAYPKASREAARRAGSRLLTNVDIASAISERVAERAMSQHEVLDRLAEQARGSMGDFLITSQNGDVQVDVAKAQSKAHLIKKVTQRRTIRTTEKAETEETVLTFELYDAQSALTLIGRHHGIFKDKVEINHSGNVGFNADEAAQAERELKEFDEQRSRATGGTDPAAATD